MTLANAPRCAALRNPCLVALGAMRLALATGCGAGDASSPEDTQSNADPLTANEKAAYDYFVAKGLQGYEAAGIVGNLIQESNVNPELGAVRRPGRGIAQWSAGGRWNADGGDNAVWYASKEGQSVYALDLQLDFVWYELQTFSGYGLAELRGSGNVSQATIAFETRFEGCGQCDQCDAHRLRAAGPRGVRLGRPLPSPAPGGPARGRRRGRLPGEHG